VGELYVGFPNRESGRATFRRPEPQGPQDGCDLGTSEKNQTKTLARYLSCYVIDSLNLPASSLRRRAFTSSSFIINLADSYGRQRLTLALSLHSLQCASAQSLVKEKSDESEEQRKSRTVNSGSSRLIVEEMQPPSKQEQR
jgi:hypothetical protein